LLKESWLGMELCCTELFRSQMALRQRAKRQSLRERALPRFLVACACLLRAPSPLTQHPGHLKPITCSYGGKFMRRTSSWKRGSERNGSNQG